MDSPAKPDFLTDIADALDWWRGAGVDCDFVDQPCAWLTPPELPAQDHSRAPAKPTSNADAEPPPAPPRIDTATLPQDLSAFAPWWLSEPLLDDGNLTGRIAPQGKARSALMVIVDEPEAEDHDTLLSGSGGRLLDAMLRAFGFRRDDIYLASALPRHTPGPDWSAIMQRGIGDVLAHHISLVRPERLLVLGGNVLPLIGHELPQASAALRQFNQQGASIPMLVSWGLPSLMRQPSAKQSVWNTWVQWTAA